MKNPMRLNLTATRRLNFYLSESGTIDGDGIAGGASDGAKEDSTPFCLGLTSFHPDQYGQPGIYLPESSDDGWRRISWRCK
jgi:hypothetical protein